ncbi:NrsF family protein [Mesorhizobium sp. L-8-10]|uniref:NrsF family protein n=1 Tax=Mesorhizobium sp. L-8-10 TaxID=2744523 RepID=UPI00237A90AD|nr:NrsF family protein [Mesorhizobium sp. L-8-10]
MPSKRKTSRRRGRPVCFPMIAAVGAVPALAMVTMLHKGAPLAPRVTVLLGALAAAALGNFGLRLFHPQDASLMVLVWQFGSVVLLSMLAGWNGRRILAWRHLGFA